MDKKQQQILIYTFALQFDDEQLKAEFKAGRVTQEQYLEITDLKREKSSEEIEKLSTELKEEIKIDKEKAEQIEQEKKAKREAQVEKISTSTTEVKDNLKKNKSKYTKIAVAGIALIVVVLMVVNIGKFVFTNYIGFTDVDLGSMVIIDYDTDSYAADPSFTWNGSYYSESGYYDDFKADLKNTGLYTDDEIDKLIPKYDAETYSAISSIYTGYELSSEDILLNGDTVEVTVNYDSALAKQSKINVVNNKASFEIKGLREQVTSDEITKKALDNAGGIEALEAKVLDTYEIASYSRYTPSIGAEKFLFEDAVSKPSDLKSDEDSNYYSDDYYSDDYYSDDYTQHVHIAYYINNAYRDSDGEREAGFDDVYLCSQELDVYKQNGNVVIEDSVEYVECTSIATDIDNINDAIDLEGPYVGLDGEYTTLEGML